jgi:hypothetical protein
MFLKMNFFQAANNTEYVLQANDAAEMNAWLTAIQQCMTPDVPSSQTSVGSSNS